MRQRRTAPVAAALALAASLGLSATASAAERPAAVGPAPVADVPCGAPAPPDRDGARWTERSGPLRLYGGTSTDCVIYGIPLPSRYQVNHHCYTRDRSGVSWTFLRVLAPPRAGWVPDHLLPDGGALWPC